MTSRTTRKRSLLCAGFALMFAVALSPIVGARAEGAAPRLDRLPQGALGPGAATTVAIPGQITGITLLPSNKVGIGTEVTVRVEGTGTCTVFVETNGASDYEGGFGDYQVGPGVLPMTVKFAANTAGNFQIAATGATPDGDLCVAGGNFAVNTILEVHQRAGSSPGRIELVPSAIVPDAPGPVQRPRAVRRPARR